MNKQASTEPVDGSDSEGGTTDSAVVEAPAKPKLSPLDASLRGVRSRPTYSTPPSVFDVPKPTTLPSQLLDPGNVTSLPGYVDGSMPDPIVSALHAFTALHDAEARTIAAREELRGNEALSPGDQVIALVTLQSKLSEAATRKADYALGQLKASIAADEQALRQPLRTSATAPFGAEVRQALRSMPQADRTKALNAAIAEGNLDIVGPALGAPAMLSGLDQGVVTAMSESWNRARQPAVVARLEMMRTIEARLTKAGSHFVANFEGALGVKRETVARIRAAKASAAKVLA